MSISIILERALPLGEDILSRIHSGELVVSGEQFVIRLVELLNI